MNAPGVHGIGMTSQRTRNRLIQRLRDAGIHNEAVLQAMGEIPRHLFVQEALSSRAYEDTALPIGHGQTISQPWVVATMTAALLEQGTPASVLEIGTGSGYQATVLSKLVPQVYTVERVEELFRAARRVFRAVGARNIRCKKSDGYLGWPENAPFEAIMLTAAPPRIPQALLDQLSIGGRLIAPVGEGQHQRLICVSRSDAGFEQTDLGGVIFVPMLQGLE